MIRLLRAIGVAVLERAVGKSCGVCGERTAYLEAHHYIEHGDMS